MTYDQERRFTLDYYYKTMKNGTYIAANLSEESKDSLAALQKRLGIKDPLPKDDFHCTLMYSKKGDPDVRPQQYKEPKYAEVDSLDLLGDDKNCLVIKLNSEHLQMRHQQLIMNGLTHSYSTYNPHITLTYNYQGEPMDEELLYDENGECIVLIEFVDEFSEPLD